MNEYNPQNDPAAEAAPAAGTAAPVVPVAEKPFIVSKAEIVFSLLSYAAAYIYILLFFNDIGRFANDESILWRTLPVIAFAVAAVLVLNKKRKATAESWFWLVCLLSLVTAFTFRFYGVWNQGFLYLLIHPCMVWWVLHRSGRLLEKESGHFLPMDAVNGLFTIPFYHFFLRIRTWTHGLSRSLSCSKGKKKNWLWIVAALIAVLLLFKAAAGLLIQADSNFGEHLKGITDWLHIDSETLFYIILSLPAGAYIYGLIGGSVRFEETKLQRQKASLERFLVSIRRVPAAFWAAAVLLFSVLYIAFFALQASYFLGGFNHTLPEGFIFSQYAREGFFELCRVMAVNFLLLWLVTRMSEVSDNKKNSRLLKTSCLLLLIESLLFAAIAASKIALYISVYGWTAKRIQSLWLVGVLAGACIAWALHLLSGKKTMKIWLMISAGAMCALAFVTV